MSKSHKDRPQPSIFGLPQTGVDSHAHLDSKPLWPDLEKVLSRAADAGLAHIGQVFLSHAAYTAIDEMEQRASTIAKGPRLFYLLGIHPTDGVDVDDSEWNLLRKDFQSDTRLRAVGEIGLDFYWKDCPRDVQERIFRLQLALAKEVQKPVVIHSRDAFVETIAILDEEGFREWPLLWHCFGGDTRAAEEILSRGWHISIPGPVTYAANQTLRNALPAIPINRLLLETDCPYLSPLPWRGHVNEPALSAFTAQTVAEAKGMELAELWTLCGKNAELFFGLS